MSILCTSWIATASAGSVALIHPETHFTDEKAGPLRRETYQRLRRHWQFLNELSLFEVHHLVSYGVHVYAASRSPRFVQATSLYHPSTVERSLEHDGSGIEPGLKDEDGNWDLRPHASRIQHVDETTLATWHAILETDDVPVDRTRMVYTVNTSTAAVLSKLADAPRISELGLKFSSGWHETNDRAKGYFEVDWGVPESWDQVILQGPHLHVANPAYKTPNPTMLHNQDWTPVDLEALPADWIPATSYKPAVDRATYDAAYTHWDGDPARNHYRIAWRAMAANTGERTLISAIIPPGAAHINGVFSLGSKNAVDVVLAAAVASSLIADFAVRAAPKSGIYQGVFERLPSIGAARIRDELLQRVVRLTCVVSQYAPLWEEITGVRWAPGSATVKAAARRQLGVEIDVLMAIALGINADELCTIYRTQFPVLYGYDKRAYFFDAGGRLVPSRVLGIWRSKGDAISEDERRLIHPGSGLTYTYELPFVAMDREDQIRKAFQRFDGYALANDENFS